MNCNAKLAFDQKQRHKHLISMGMEWWLSNARTLSPAMLGAASFDTKVDVLSWGEKAIILAFQRHTLLPLDDFLYVLQATAQHLTRSSLHCGLQRIAADL